MNMKRCTQCGVPKPLEQFQRDCTRADDRRSYCRDCAKHPTGQSNGVRRRSTFMALWKDDVRDYPELAPPPVVLPSGEVIA